MLTLESHNSNVCVNSKLKQHIFAGKETNPGYASNSYKIKNSWLAYHCIALRNLPASMYCKGNSGVIPTPRTSIFEALIKITELMIPKEWLNKISGCALPNPLLFLGPTAYKPNFVIYLTLSISLQLRLG